MQNIKFIFFGTPEFSVCVLNALEAEGFLPALVITAPDKPRGLELAAPPVREWALKRGIDVLQPPTLKDEATLAALDNTDWDVFIVAAYAKLLPQNLLDMPRRECLNIHPSLLPKLRGASPVISAILADLRETGVTIMRMTAGMDAGPIVAQAKIEIDEDDWPPPAVQLTDLLFTEGGNLLAEALPLWAAGKISETPQNDSEATFTKKFSDEDALIDLSSSKREQFLKIRAFDRGPRAHFFAQKGTAQIRVIISEASWKNNQLTIEKVIPEGKKEISYEDFVRSYTL